MGGGGGGRVRGGMGDDSHVGVASCLRPRQQNRALNENRELEYINANLHDKRC